MSDFNRHPLALQAANVLEGGGYQTESVVLPQTEVAVLVAENPYAVVAVVGVDEWRQVAGDADSIATDFVNWAVSRQPQAKQWDLYLCLLVAQPLENDDELAQVERFADDTRYLRRLIRHGVAGEHVASVRTALAALLPLQLPDRVSERDPYGALVDALRSRGVDGELALQTVERFLARTGTDR